MMEKEEERVSSHEHAVRTALSRNRTVCRNRAQCVNTRVPRFTQSAYTA